MTSSRDSHHPLALRSAPQGSQSGSRLGSDPTLAGRLASAEQTLRDISHALAHDLRTSLRHVISYAQLLGDPAYADQPEAARKRHISILAHQHALRRSAPA